MNRNNLTRFIIVLIVLVWAFAEMWPPLGRDLGDVFVEKAVPKFMDADFTNIVTRYRELQKTNPLTAYKNLSDAVGNVDITKYFPGYTDVATAPNPSHAVLDHLQQDAAGKIKMGLDLIGGTEFVVAMDTNYLANETTNAQMYEYRQKQAISEAIDVLRRRVDNLGVAEPVIRPEGADRIVVQLPGLSDSLKKQAEENIKKAAHLELRLVHTNSAEILAEGLVEPGYQKMLMKEVGENGVVTYTNMLVARKVEMTGEHIERAQVSRDMAGRATVTFKLDSVGTDMFGKLTRENTGRLMAIVLDGELQSAPRINEPIETGSVEISRPGGFPDEEAQELANTLQNPLAAPLRIESETSVDPTLGADTVRSGVRSAIIGTLLVAGFMACYYLLAGAVADVALVTNIIILLGVMCSIPATFTLPGIAGVVLTIGMAVDANVLIFERIREEKAKGKSLRGALSAGYDRAFGTIFDSHVTTLISSIILIYMGTGPIKGFGVTLTIGVAASLFTALVVTRLIFDFLIGREFIKDLKMLHIIRATRLDFMKLAKLAFAISWTIIIIGLAYGIFVRGNNMLGIDFKGGDSLTLTYSNKVDSAEITAALTKAGFREPGIQYQQDPVSTNRFLKITSEYGSSTNVLTTLTSSFPSAGFSSKGSEAVGPTIGTEITINAIEASLLSLLGILLYVAVRYEFSFAVGAVVAVIHDVLMTIGCYCLTGLFHEHGQGRQFNATMVAAILTIIGFSINDTIVIFDRIREDLKMGVRGSFKDLINQALNQTLSRTIITSGTVFLATISLYVFGGGAINDFAFTFLVGIITGTYSSIYIASALVLWWHRGERPRTSNVQMVVENSAAASKP